ncbi:MAG: hypothetical protein IPN13_16945 [Bacteroidetes bacterium]|nr:hypothetical protein [Bacteroidota bacterium]
MRTIRAIIRKAIKSGLLDNEYYPFNSYKIKSVPTEKRALDLNYLERIFKLEIPSDSPIFHARNYFIASYMMNGINFKDMALLEKLISKMVGLATAEKKHKSCLISKFLLS